MTTPDLTAANNTLLRSQLHTVRERLHLVERRLHDIESAQQIAVQRADIYGDTISDIRQAIAAIVRDLEEMKEP